MKQIVNEILTTDFYYAKVDLSRACLNLVRFLDGVEITLRVAPHPDRMEGELQIFQTLVEDLHNKVSAMFALLDRIKEIIEEVQDE